APEFGFDGPAGDVSEFLQRFDDEMMHTDMAGVEIVIVREENDFRFLLVEDFGDARNRSAPLLGKFFAPGEVDVFEAVFGGLDEAETDVIAGRFQFPEAFGLARFVAPLSDGDVDYA